MEKNGAGRYPCHIYEIEDPEAAYKALQTELIRDYGDTTVDDNGRFLHWNHTWDEGGRMLLRCKTCGGLMILQSSEFHSFTDDPDGYYSDWIPAASEEEARLLNQLLDVLDFEDYPCRHLRRNNGRLFWTKGEEPRDQDPEVLRTAIRRKYGKSGEIFPGVSQREWDEALRLFLANPYWREYHETAPTEKCRAYIGLEYCNSNRGSDAIRKAMKQTEAELTLEDWKHLLKYSGNDPKRGYIRKKIRELEER